ncbi:MAG: tRNA 2-thiouridine(34) synthase MnmA [Candidatus Margulisiibacteriota bacterium]
MKIAAALSGGVDSAVAAALLKEQGHELVGMTALVWPNSRCCDDRALHDAKLVADTLEIPYFTVDVMKEFRESVVEDFINEYIAGRTPSPCPLCNRTVRFAVMWDKILGHLTDCEAIATGHYAIIEDLGKGRVALPPITPRWALRKGVDPNKDQSYMLYGLSQEQLSRTLTPLGTYTKEEVRKLAEKYNLPVSKKPDSQDACFVDKDYKQFLSEQAAGRLPGDGDIVDAKGNVLGRHNGIINYTIGQRKGLNLAREGTDNQPLYVTGIDAEKNMIIVGGKDQLYSAECIVCNINWIIPVPQTTINITVRIRYNSREVPAEVSPLGDTRAKIFFKDPQPAVTPGQAAVFYNGDIVAGGGIIK